MHNGLLLSIIYYRDALQARGWAIEEQRHLPIAWHALAVVGILLGGGLLIVATRAPSAAPNPQPRGGEIDLALPNHNPQRKQT
jgi:hypothetical protein